MNFVIYGNGSAGNHGCEAITRGTVALLGKENTYILQSLQPEDDTRYGLHNLAQICNAVGPFKKNLRFLWTYLKLKLTGDYTEMDRIFLFYIARWLDSITNSMDMNLSKSQG